MKRIRIHRSEKESLIHQLGLQADVLRECILMFEHGDSCIEVIKRIQTVESALSAVNTQLLNIHLTKCLVKLGKIENIDTALREISGLYSCVDKSPEKMVEILQ